MPWKAHIFNFFCFLCLLIARISWFNYGHGTWQPWIETGLTRQQQAVGERLGWLCRPLASAARKRPSRAVWVASLLGSFYVHRTRSPLHSAAMAATQRMKVANEKADKYITMRGNVPKSSVSGSLSFVSAPLSDLTGSDLLRILLYTCVFLMYNRVTLLSIAEGKRWSFTCWTLAPGTFCLCCLRIRWEFGLNLHNINRLNFFSLSSDTVM